MMNFLYYLKICKEKIILQNYLFYLSKEVFQHNFRQFSEIFVKLFWIWTSSSGGDIVKRYFLSRALMAPFIQQSGTICANLVESIMRNISVKWYWIWTIGSHESSNEPWHDSNNEPWRDFQQCGILPSEDSDGSVQILFKLRNSKWCSVSSLTLIEYSSDKQRLWSDCTYAQADLRLCWSHIPHCWKSHVAAQIMKHRTTICYLRKRYALAVNCWVIIHCLEVSCKVDQITNMQREWFIFVKLTD